MPKRPKIRPRRGALTPPRTGQGVTIHEAIDRFTAGKQPTTVTSYKAVARRYAQYLEAHGIWWTQVIPADIDVHLANRRREGAAQDTIRYEVTALRALYRWAQVNRVARENPAALVKPPPAPTRSAKRWFTREEARRLLAASRQAEPAVALAVHLSLLNGLRTGDVTSAVRDHVRQLDGRTVLWLPHRKNGRMDTVSLPAPTVALIPDEPGPLIPWTQTPLNDRLDQLAVSAGVDAPLRLHELRTTFITLALDAGVPPRDVMASAGHATLSTTAYYDRAYASVRRNASGRITDYILSEEEEEEES